MVAAHWQFIQEAHAVVRPRHFARYRYANAQDHAIIDPTAWAAVIQAKILRRDGSVIRYQGIIWLSIPPPAEHCRPRPAWATGADRRTLGRCAKLRQVWGARLHGSLLDAHREEPGM